MAREIGTVIGDYRIIGTVGRGGSGEVYKVEHAITHRVEAIKFLADGRPATAEEEQQFLQEIEVHAALQHPCIAAVHNACRSSEGLAMVMEYVEGEPLSAVLERGRVLPRDGLHYALQTLEALEYAHGRGVIHRDVKPQNIIVTPDGSVKLTDFGLARLREAAQLSQAGVPTGSPYYMSPEQIAGVAPADARSDYYSLGVVLYEIATGRRPFESDSVFEVMLQQRDTPPVPPVRVAPEIGAELNSTILKAMEKDPSRRFQSAAEFRSALERALSAERRRTGVRRSVAAVGGVLLAAGILLLGALLRLPPRAKHQPAPAPVVRPTPAPPPSAAAPSPPAAPSGPAAAAAPARPEDPEPEPEAAPHKATVPERVPVGHAVPAPVVTSPAPVKPPKTAGHAAASTPALDPAPAVPPPNLVPPPAADVVPAGALPPEPPKKRMFLWRALNRVIHPNKPADTKQP